MARATAFLMTALALAALRCDGGHERRFDAAHDSVTVVAYFKGWGDRGSLDLDMLDAEWKADSTTLRLRSTGSMYARTRGPYPDAFEFDVLRVCSRDSIWVRAHRLRSLDPSPPGKEGALSDSVLITRVVRWWGTSTMDGGTWVGLRMAPEWHRRARPTVPGPTYTLAGRVEDMATGKPCRVPPWHPRSSSGTAVVHEAWGMATANADSLGHFTLSGLHAGWVKLNVSSFDYSFVSRLVHVPAESVVVRLIPGTPASLQRAIAEAIAPPSIWPPRFPRQPLPRDPYRLDGSWRGTTTCTDPSLDAACTDERAVFRFTLLERGASSAARRVGWRREDGEQAPDQVPLVSLPGSHRWMSEVAGEPGGRSWEFVVTGDTLVGQLLDPYTRVVAREFWARRVGD